MPPGPLMPPKPGLPTLVPLVTISIGSTSPLGLVIEFARLI